MLTTAAGCGSSLTSPDGGNPPGCVVNRLYLAPGRSIPASDGCNTCSCTANGQTVCTTIACLSDAGTCALDTTYRYGETGGLVAYVNETTLTPPGGYVHDRTSVITDPPDTSCAPALPPCNVDGAVDVADIMRDVADTDAQDALAMASPPTYGRDARTFDGTIFQFIRADGHGFLAGDDCGLTTGPGGCVALPAGIVRLVADLRALDQQQLQDPSCAALR